MIKVLVFPCGSEIALEIHSALKFNKAVRLFGVSSVPDHGEYVYRHYRQIGAQVDSPDFIEQLNALIDEWEIDIVLPAHDSVVLALAEQRTELKTLAAVPELAVARLCRNKNATYACFASSDFVPRSIVEPAEGIYPIFAKPAVGQGSQGAERVMERARHVQLLAGSVEYVFSEYLPGIECTVDCISDSNGELLHLSPRVRERVKSGISVATQPLPVEARIQSIAGQIASALRIRGAWFFQLKRDARGQWMLLEVAPRVAGSMALSRNLGVNYALLTVYAYLNMPFHVLAQDFPIRLDRALGNRFRVAHQYDCVYLDLDDTLLVDGRVHPLMAALLYQWQAQKVSIILVTRHTRCPRQTLSEYHLAESLFESIVHIQDGGPKSAVIDDSRRAIFIDDSWRERLDVSRQCGIPVFDIDALEQLLDCKA